MALGTLALTASAQDADPAAPPPGGGIGASSSPGSFAATGSFPSTTIHSNIAGDPSADVPGLPGAHFSPGSGTTHFDRVYGSPGGNWIISADTDLATTEDELILLNDVVVAREGTQAPWAPMGENTGLIDTKLGVNDAGDFAFATNTDAATTVDDYIIKGSNFGAVWTIVAQEGSSTGIASLPGTTWDDILDSPAITGAGVVGLSGDGIDGGAITTTTDDILVLGSTLLSQEGVTIHPGQMGAEFAENYDLSLFFVSDDGMHWCVQGDLTGDTNFDDVLIVDGNVVLQEGVVIPGSGFADPIDVSGIVGSYMDAGGNWYARGNNDVSETDWVVRNGTVIATLGQSIDGSSMEVWDDSIYSDCFFVNVGNSVGDWVIGGVTDNADILRNGVLVLNGSKEIVREGDPVDLNNNGMFDDGLFFDTFGNDDAHLTDGGALYIVATIKDGANTQVGQGLFRFELGSLGTNYCTSTVNSTGTNATIAATGSASIAANDLVLVVSNVPTVPGVGIPIAGPNQGQLPYYDGFLCIDPVGLQRINQFVVPDASGTVTQPIDYTGASTGTAALFVVAGQAYNYQYWFRDPTVLGTNANFSDAIEIVHTP